jgi:hypothetical protein
MKTGRLLKLRRPQGVIHVYFYREGSRFHAAVYSVGDESGHPEPIHRVEGENETTVETETRAWIDRRFPPSST